MGMKFDHWDWKYWLCSRTPLISIRSVKLSVEVPVWFFEARCKRFALRSTWCLCCLIISYFNKIEIVFRRSDAS